MDSFNRWEFPFYRGTLQRAYFEQIQSQTDRILLNTKIDALDRENKLLKERITLLLLEKNNHYDSVNKLPINSIAGKQLFCRESKTEKFEEEKKEQENKEKSEAIKKEKSIKKYSLEKRENNSSSIEPKSTFIEQLAESKFKVSQKMNKTTEIKTKRGLEVTQEKDKKIKNYKEKEIKVECKIPETIVEESVFIVNELNEEKKEKKKKRENTPYLIESKEKKIK